MSVGVGVGGADGGEVDDSIGVVVGAEVDVGWTGAGDYVRGLSVSCVSRLVFEFYLFLSSSFCEVLRSVTV